MWLLEFRPLSRSQNTKWTLFSPSLSTRYIERRSSLYTGSHIKLATYIDSHYLGLQKLGVSAKFSIIHRTYLSDTKIERIF